MDSPTEQETTKNNRRTRFADDTNNKNDSTDPSTKIEAPIKLVDSFIRKNLASLPPNHHQI